jgi:hypothetical protein
MLNETPNPGQEHFAIYHKMKAMLGGKWERYNPGTNVKWLERMFEKIN